jgi:23S rRNA pseudouridine2605 synthase
MTEDKRPSRRPGQRPRKAHDDSQRRPTGSGDKRESRAPRREGGFAGKKEYKPRRSDGAEGGERRPPRREGGFAGKKEYKPRRSDGAEGGERRPPRREGGFAGKKEYKPRRNEGEEGGERRPPRREGGFAGKKEYKPRRSDGAEGGERRPPRREGSYKAFKESGTRRTGPRKEREGRPERRKADFGEKRGKPFDAREGKKERFDKKARPAPKIKKYTGTGEDRGDYIPKWQREEDATLRLNKFIANSGICSRREADDLIQAGVVTVNGKVVTELGTKIKPSDKVVYGGELLSNEGKRYLLLNKQKGYVTTTKDPHAKNTVMDLIAGACKERIYPVGRLDRNTTGLLLFTNDGELSKKLMHPSSKITKLYHVVLDQPFKKADMLKVTDGIELEDGLVQIDSIAYDVTADNKKELGVEIHSGKNRVIRRLFEALGYKVVKLDRVMFAGLTKKNLPRGRWRFLTDREISILKRV